MGARGGLKSESRDVTTAPPLASKNFQADFSISKFEDDVKIMAAVLAKSDLNVFFNCISTQTPIRYITHAYQSAEYDKETDSLSFHLVDESSESLSKFRFVSLLGGHEGISELPPVYEPLPNDEDLSSFLAEIGYDDSPPNMGDLKKAKFPAPWHMAVHFVLRCLSVRPVLQSAQVSLILIPEKCLGKRDLPESRSEGLIRPGKKTGTRRKRLELAGKTGTVVVSGRLATRCWSRESSTACKTNAGTVRTTIGRRRSCDIAGCNSAKEDCRNGGKEKQRRTEERLGLVGLPPGKRKELPAWPWQWLNALASPEEAGTSEVRQSGKTGGTDAIVKDLLRLLYGWNDFRQYVLAKKTEVPSARFWSVILNKIYADHPTIAPAEDNVMYKPPLLSKYSTNPKCPPSIRRLPQHLLRTVGMKRKVVKEYLAASANILPAIADIGADPVDTAAQTHASEEEEETVSQPLQNKPKTVKFKSPPKTLHTLGKHAQPSIILSHTFHKMHTRTSTYGEPTRTKLRPSEHFSHGQGSSVSPKELTTIAGSGGQGSNIFRLGSYVNGLYGASGRAQLLRELESHCCEQFWATRDMQGLGVYSMRGYGSNLALIAGADKEVPEKPTPEKKRKEVPEKATPEKKRKVTKKASPEKNQSEKESSDDSIEVFSSLLKKKAGSKPTQQEIDLLKNTLLQLAAQKEQQAATAKAAAEAEATKSTADKPPPQKTKPAPQPPKQSPPKQPPPPPKHPTPPKETVPPHQSSLQEGGDEFSGHFSAYFSKKTELPFRIRHCSSLQKRKRQDSSEKKLIIVSPPKQHDQPQPPPQKKKTTRRKALSSVVFPGVTRREFTGMTNKMDRVLETVDAYPAPATDAELNSRLSSIVQDVVDKHLTAALSKQADRLADIKESSKKTILNLNGLMEDIAKRHGFDIAERDQRIRDLERLTLKLISAGETMVLMTKKLEEAVPRSKGGDEDEATKKKPSLEKIDPEKIIYLEKTPPSPEAKKKKTPPADPKDKSIAAGQGPEKKETPKKTVDPTKPGPSSPKADESESSSFSGDEDESEKARKVHLAETECLGTEAALLLQKEQDEEEARRMEERRLREEEEAARLAAQRPIITHVQRVPPTGKDIVPFKTYALPVANEVLDCPVSKNAALIPMMDPIKGETNVGVRAAFEYKRSRDFILKHASSRAALYSRSRIVALHKIKTRKFQNCLFFEYGIERADGSSRIINFADFHRMNSADLLELGHICRQRAETKLEIKFHYLALRDIINAIMHDIGYEDAELHFEFNVAPPVQEQTTSLEGIDDISRGYSTAPIRAMLFEGEPEEGSSPTMLCFRLEEKHLYPTDLLCSFTQSIEDDEHMDADVKVSFVNKLKWFLAVRKHWRALVQFIDNE
ncbi:hypothetical protein LXL04_039055 [Taraxacum kok-saghyz]